METELKTKVEPYLKTEIIRIVPIRKERAGLDKNHVSGNEPDDENLEDDDPDDDPEPEPESSAG